VLSELAAQLLAELKAISGGKLCVKCAGNRLDMDRHGVLKAMRELVLTGHIIHGLLYCSACREVHLVAFLSPFGIPRVEP